MHYFWMWHHAQTDVLSPEDTEHQNKRINKHVQRHKA